MSARRVLFHAVLAIALSGCIDDDDDLPATADAGGQLDGSVDMADMAVPDLAVVRDLAVVPDEGIYDMDRVFDVSLPADQGMPDQGPDMPTTDMGTDDMGTDANLSDGGPSDGGTDGGAPDGGDSDGGPDMAPDGGEVDGGDDMAQPGVCVGPDPADPPPYPEVIEDCGVSCEGAPTPVWSLNDFQPQSCGFEQSYGLNAFQGRVTLFATFNAGCGFCQAQAEGLEQMRLELEFAGHAVWFVALNSASNLGSAERLIERCGFPLMQDTEELNVWELQNGGVSDFYIYDVDGRLVRHYDQTDERAERGRSLTLSNEDDYNELKQAIIDAIP